MYCNHCGRELENGTVFCDICKKSVINLTIDTSKNVNLSIDDKNKTNQKQITYDQNADEQESGLSSDNNNEKGKSPKKRGLKAAIISAIILLICSVGIVIFFKMKSNKSEESEDSKDNIVSGPVRVIFDDGNYSDSVVNDVTLPTKFDDENVTWSSSDPDIISDTGKVTRPTDDNKTVVLTAVITDDEGETVKEFEVTVIRDKGINTDEIQSYTIDDIIELNQDNPYFSIEYNYALAGKIEEIDDCPVESIYGKFSDIKIESAEDALYSLYSVKDLLKINNPAEELKIDVVNHGEYGNGYVFSQLYNGTEVYGRSLVVNCDENGNARSVESSCYTLDRFFDVNDNATVSHNKAVDIAKELYEDNVKVTYSKDVIYNLDNYEANPVLAYVLLASNAAVSDTIIMNATDGSIIFKGSNIYY